MDDITKKLIIWGIITLASIIIAIICYKWISNVARFENRKKEIALGMIVCVLAISSMMFLPILFSMLDLHILGQKLFDQIQFAERVAEDNGMKLLTPPFIRPFAHILATITKAASMLIVFISTVVSLLIILFVTLVILNIREPKKKEGEEYNRKHLFEYNSEIISKLNKDSQR